MKKITSMLLIILALFTVLSFASCNALKTEEVINNAIENTSKLSEYEANMSMVFDMKMTGMTMNVPMDVSMKVKDADKENPTVWASMETTVLGQKMEVETYMDDEYIYVVTDGEGYKANATEADDQYNYTESVDEMFKELPVDLIKDIELVKGEDGSYTITVSIPDETFKELYADFIDEMNESALGEVVGNITISDCTVTVTVKDDYVISYGLSYNMSMTVQGMSVDSSVTGSIEFVNPGSNVTITPPSGYESFEDLTGFDW